MKCSKNSLGSIEVCKVCINESNTECLPVDGKAQGTLIRAIETRGFSDCGNYCIGCKHIEKCSSWLLMSTAEFIRYKEAGIDVLA